jgi:5-carboxymethyl-2-hydroxymuconate isomerase
MDFEGKLSKSTNIQGITFKSLLNQNFSKYILILKKFYPLFKFNHYYSNKENQNKKNRRNNIKNNEKYIQSTLLDILGLQENITVDPEKFLIKRDFLERTSLDELIMIKDDLVMKTGMIDKELNKIVAYNTNKIYIYIENNIIIGHKIDCYLFSMKGKRECKMNLKEKFIGNSAKLFLIENKKQNMIKIKNYFLEIKNIKDDFIKLDFIIEESESENKIQEISDLINIIRNKIKSIKSKDIFKSLKIISEMEKELVNYENRGEEFLIIEFKKIIMNLISQKFINYQLINIIYTNYIFQIKQ